MSALRRIFSFPRADRWGATRLELLLCAPVLVLLLGLTVEWSGYFWLSSRVQQAADAALAAALAADAPHEQERQARRAAARILPGEELAIASRVALLQRAGGLAVQVSYDASHWPIYQLGKVLPAPPSSVVRISRPVGTAAAR